MKLVKSKQRGVKFAWCPSPIVIDKRADWGDSGSNLQNGPNGAFLKVNGDGSISHLVQPNADKTAPIGWVKTVNDGEFDKNPIWISPEVLEVGSAKKMSTLDGDIEYQIKEPSLVTYNDRGGEPDLKDGWIQLLKDVMKNYEY
jgi:hypothetical protein